MMTVREAHLRAEVYGLRIYTRNYQHGRLYGAAQSSWHPKDKRINWRDDIEDAVMDCRKVGRL